MLSSRTQLGRYEIVAPLGKGGMGEVYRARDTRLGRDVAIKVLPEPFAQDRVRQARFEREAMAIATLSHPNILAIHDYGAEQGISFAVMELLEGETLRARVARSALPWRQALEIAAAIADGLAAAHAKGVIHRDLKPENLFLTADGRVKVLDFGLAQIEPGPSSLETAPYLPALTETGVVMGTVGYMSPEQVRGLPVDSRSDLFSLGCVLYEMIAGKAPFRRETSADTIAAILHETPPSLSALGRDVPAEVACAIARCLAKSPDERFPSARDLTSTIAGLLRGTDVAQHLLPTEPILHERDGVDLTQAATTAHAAPLIPTTVTEAAARPVKRRLLQSLTLALGCGLATLLLCALPAAGVYWLVSNYSPKIEDWFKAEMARQHQWEDVARFWRAPPADAGPELLFPAQVKEYQLVEHDANADVSDLKIQAPGRRAVYKSGSAAVELFVYRATALEKEALLRRAQDVLSPKEESDSDDESNALGSHGYRSVRHSDTALSYEIGPGLTPNQFGVFWWDQNWLFLARSTVVRDPGAFLKDYLAALSAASAAEGGKAD